MATDKGLEEIPEGKQDCAFKVALRLISISTFRLHFSQEMRTD